MSLRSTAFFIEVILEAAKFSTSTGLGLTRRALISAIGSARALHDRINPDSEWDAKAAGKAAITTNGVGDQQVRRRAPDDGFIAILDKYTAVGIYVIHHSFSMAELFAMSGFYLVDTGFKAGIQAADESVRMIDGIFGSNETSRALSSFIGLVRKEFSGEEGQDEEKGAKARGRLHSVKMLASLTKAITAFAVLQNATYKRTAPNHKMKVLYDCTVLGEVEASNWRSYIVGSANCVKKAQKALNQPPPPPRSSSSVGGSGGGKHFSSYQQDAAKDSMTRSSRSHYGGDSLCLTDVGSDALYELDEYDDRAAHAGLTSRELGRDDASVVEDLRYLVGSDAEEDELLIPRPPVAPNGGGDGCTPVIRRTIRRRDPEHGTIETVYEEVTETTTEETIETRTISSNNSTRSTSGGLKSARLANPFGPLIPTRDRSKTSQQPEAKREEPWTDLVLSADRRDSEMMAEDEMIIDRELAGGAIPAAPNGAAPVGALARKQAMERPEESKARMQVVLKTITRKLIQKRKVVTHSTTSAVSPEEDGAAARDRELAYERKSSVEADSPPTKQRPAESSSRSASGRNTLQNLFTKGSGNKAIRSADVSSDAQMQDVTPPASPHIPKAYRMKSVPSSPAPPTTVISPPSPDTTPRRSKPLPARRSKQQEQQTSSASAASHSSSTQSRSRRRAPSISSMASFSSTRKETHTTSHTTSSDIDKRAKAHFPHLPFVQNLHTFMRHSSAAYGQNFMRIFGIGTAEYLFADTQKHHSNIWAYAHHVGIPVDNIILSSFTEGESSFHSEKMSPIVNFISIDDDAKAVILTCRGTLGLSDILTDLTCEYEDIAVQGGKPDGVYQAHSGMLASAIRLKDPKSTIHATLRQALETRPDYGLVVTGHSLGGGVAALLAIMWSSPTDVFRDEMISKQPLHVRHPPIQTPFVTSLSSGLPAGRPIHCYAYGVPAVGSLDLSRYCSGLVTSLVHGHDIVPHFSIGTVRDMRNVAENLADERESTMAQEIVGAVVGLYQRKRKAAAATTTNPAGAAATSSSVPSMADMNFPRPSEPPAQERELTMDAAEIMQGHSRNAAFEPGYEDPVMKHDLTAAPAPEQQQLLETDNETRDWLWSLIKTMRASMGEEKLYPPGDVFCIESFTVYVTPRTTHSSAGAAGASKLHFRNGEQEKLSSRRAEAHRVLLRHCPDVEARFSEPIFARSMLRDHVPTNYEFCTQLLLDSVIGSADQSSANS